MLNVSSAQLAFHASRRERILSHDLFLSHTCWRIEEHGRDHTNRARYTTRCYTRLRSPEARRRNRKQRLGQYDMTVSGVVSMVSWDSDGLEPAGQGCMAATHCRSDAYKLQNRHIGARLFALRSSPVGSLAFPTNRNHCGGRAVGDSRILRAASSTQMIRSASALLPACHPRSSKTRKHVIIAYCLLIPLPASRVCHAKLVVGSESEANDSRLVHVGLRQQCMFGQQQDSRTL